MSSVDTIQPTPDDIREAALKAHRDYVLEHGASSSQVLDGVRSVAGDTIGREAAVEMANRVHMAPMMDSAQMHGFHGAMLASVELREEPLPPETRAALEAEYPYLQDEAIDG